jgi:hypothetical protein
MNVMVVAESSIEFELLCHTLGSVLYEIYESELFGGKSWEVSPKLSGFSHCEWLGHIPPLTLPLSSPSPLCVPFLLQAA